MNLQDNIKWLLIAVALIYIVKLWFDYKKVAVNAKGYPKTVGMMYLLIAFMTFTGVLSLSDKLLNWLFSQLGVNLIDAEKLADNKLILFSAFVVLAIATVFILKKSTKTAKENLNINTVEKGVGSVTTKEGPVNIEQTFNSGQSPEVSEHLIKEAERKNQEIDALKAKLKIAISPQEKLELSAKINELEAGKASLKEKIQTLEYRLKAYSDNVAVVKEANKRYQEKGIDVALDYLESIDFDKALQKHQQSALDNAKALLIKADLYTIKNKHSQADHAYQQSIQFKRTFDNTTAYASYLSKQNNFPEAIKQYSQFKQQVKQQSLALSEPQQAQLNNNLANASARNNNNKKAETAYDEALKLYRSLADKNPSAYGINLANTLVMGVDLLNQPKAYLKEAKAVLVKFKGFYRAEKLLSRIERLEKD